MLFLYKQQQHIAEAQLLAAELPGSLPQPCQGQEPQPPPMCLTSPHPEGLPGLPDVTFIHPRLWRLLVPRSGSASYKKASLKPPKFGQSTARELSSLHLCSPGSARRGGAHRGRPSTQDTTASPPPRGCTHPSPASPCTQAAPSSQHCRSCPIRNGNPRTQLSKLE